MLIVYWFANDCTNSPSRGRAPAEVIAALLLHASGKTRGSVPHVLSSPGSASRGDALHRRRHPHRKAATKTDLTSGGEANALSTSSKVWWARRPRRRGAPRKD